MRTINELLTLLRRQGIRLYLDGHRLRYQSTQSTISPSLLAELKTHKNEIIEFLQKNTKKRHAIIRKHNITEGRIPLSFAQQRLWFLDQMGSSSAYNIPIALKLSRPIYWARPLNVAALQRTLQEIVRRHESLRTTFEVSEGVPHQVIHADMSIDLPMIDLSSYAQKAQKAEVLRLTTAEATRPFDLSRDPMLRASLLRLSRPASSAADGFAEYILLLTMHHIASDGWSMGVLVREMAALYEAFSQDKPSPLPELPIQYADFAVWQRNYLQGEVLEKQLSYWKERLADAPELLQLPTDRTRPAQQSFQGGVVSLQLDTDLTDALQTLSQQQGSTLYMTLLAAFQVLMARYSGQTDIVVGSPIANRNRREIEPLIGFFVNTLALRTDLSAAPSFLALLAQVQQTVRAAYDHQDIPFERLVKELRPERNLNHNPLVQVTFALQNAPMGAFELSGLNVTPTGAEVQSTRFDLEMHLWEVDDYLQGYCIYSTDLFDKTTIERMAGHFETLLAGIVKNPTQSITELPLLTEAERHQLLVEWNDAKRATDYPKDKCIHQLFSEQVVRTPDAIALVFAPSRHDKDQKLTYRQLNERANQLAHYLIRQGVGAETLVGITVERSLEMVVGLLAILKAGGAYVPLDPSYPQERLAFMLGDCNIELLLTQEKWLANLPEGPTILALDRLDLPFAAENIANPNLSAQNLAYVMYTSGSTGRPKGVSVIHQNVVRLVKETNFIHFSTDDVFLQLAPISFDAATLEIWGPLLNGGKLVIMPPANPSLDELGYAIQRYNVSTLWLSAGLFHLMVDHQLDALRSLRWLLAGGDVLSVRHVQRAVEALPNCQLINGYGPTENTTFTCCYPIKEVSASQRSIPIGGPIANTQVYILPASAQALDNQLQPVPIGVFGELYAGGDGVARGYHNNEELTQERFIANPFDHSEQERLYRTGDIARWLPSGEIEFLGRMDTQVKLRGFRIELGEIETVLTDHANIQDAVVVASEALTTGDKQLVSYLVAGQIDSETQTEHVEQWQNLYEETYGQTSSQEDLGFNLLGWNSSYTGQPIPEIEMAEWVEGTIADIRRLQPKRVLEIGCGTGLLLSQLAPDCEVYWGTDYSQQAIEHVERLKAATPSLGHVYLEQRLADDFSGIAQHQFDCVILNSIVQYFPSVEYLLSVLEGAVGAVCPGGKIYVGDVRNLRLLSAYHAAVQSVKAADDLPLAELRERIQQRMRDEEELLIDPDFFHALPKLLPQACPDFGLITQVEIELKRGEYVNELTQFRYQVVLHVEEADHLEVDRGRIEWLEEDWQQHAYTVSTLSSRVHQLLEPSCGVVIRNIPNGRVQDAMQTLELIEQSHLQSSAKQIESVGQLRAQLAGQNDHLHPESLWALSGTLPVRVLVTWSRSAGLMDAYFVPTAHAAMPHSWPQPAGQALKAWRDYTNNPLLGKLNRTLVPKVRSWLAQKLPDYMIPSAFVMLDALPLTPNGKVDRQALPAPLSLVRRDEETFVPPTTPTQIALANIWSEVLGIEQFSVWDDFFQLGGHSLMATQVVSRIKSHFQINMPLRSLFEYPTIAELGEHIETLAKEQKGKQEQGDIAWRIVPAPRTSKIPLSFAQQRLWFLDQMGSSNAYNMPLALKLSRSIYWARPLNVLALEQTLQEIVQRHESLRTTFEVHEAVPHQVIHADMTIDLPVIDLSASAPDIQKAEAQRLMSLEATRPFDLSRDPMLRATLLRLSSPTSNTADSEHILLLTMHHIASDGWSMGVLVREMAALYEAFSQDQPSPLPDLPIQYADFAIWQRSYLQGEVLEKQLSYWKERLADAPELLQLPTDHVRPAQQSFRGDIVSLQLDAQLTAALRTLSQQEGTTLYMTLLAAFQVLISRYSGQTDIVTGSPIANRNQREIEPLIGFFVNTLGLRVDLSGAPSFLALLAQVQQTVRAAYDHQDIPFERLVEELRPERNLNHNPLVQVMFALQNAPMGRFELSGLNVTPAGSPVHTTRFDLEMHLWEVDDYLQGYCIYSTDLFDKTTIERMAGNFQTLLAEIVKNPTRSITELPLLTKAERHQLLLEWNDTATDYPKDKCIHQLFSEQVERTPDAIALVFAPSRHDQQEQLTYSELNQRANQLAHYLIELGVGTETPVGICVERSIEMVVGLLAILKAGGAYVPLDPSYPQERLAFMLSDSQIELLLTKQKWLANLPPGFTTLCLDTLELQGTPTNPMPSQNLTAHNLAYVMYTSGSTGRPKGVSVMHQNVVRLVKESNFIEFCTADVFLQLAPISFDAATLEIWGPLLNGGQLVIMPPTNPSLEELGEAIRRYKVSTLWLSAGLFHLMVDHQLDALRSLRWLLAGGDVLSVPHVQRAVQALPNCQVINGYGPTENTTFTCCYPVKEVNPSQSSIPIGRPIANTQVYILPASAQALDNQLQPVPIGVFGELYAGGDGVARGYHNNEELTQERFIANPFAHSPHQSRLYRTGDVARWLANGEIEFLGRMDTQVKLRGFRIELGEIETTLTLHPNIQDAVVVARENPLTAGDKQLVSYLVAGQIDSETQSEHVEQWQNLYEETYGQTSSQADLGFNLLGWNSSYTGQPIPEIEMAEWVEGTIADIRRLQPKRVLEIGCGTGLLLSQLAPDCEVYWGTDYSQQAIEHVERLKAATPSLGHVYLDQRLADDFSGIAQHQFDCVILNSIVQYFPSVEYLLTVLQGALRAVSPGGKIYVGDVRNLRLLSAYHAAVQSYQAADDLSLEALQTRIQQRLRDEEELLIDPEFFHALPNLLQSSPDARRIAQVEIQLKRGQYVNELTQFRYQVVLHVEKADHLEVDRGLLSWLEEDWQQHAYTVSTLSSRLHQLVEPSCGVVIRNIPNGRVQDAMQTLELLEQSHLQSSAKQIETVGQLRAQLAGQNDHLHPESLWALSETLPVRVLVTWSRSAGLMDAYFVPTAHAAMPHSWSHPAGQALIVKKAWRDYTNNPLLGKLNRTLVPKVRSWLAEKLPDYMIPSAFVMLDALPLTPNGKVDRQALPAPLSLVRRDEDTFVPPSTPTQIALANIWSEVLGIEQFSVWDDFFQLGGHSLMATQVVSRIKSHFEINMQVRSVFEYPTIAELGEHIETLALQQKGKQEQSDQSFHIVPAERTSKIPLSFAQQRLWFLDQMGSSSAYNMPLALFLRGPLNVSALQQTLQEIVRRHESLRTTFEVHEGVPHQVVHADMTIDLPVIELSAVGAEYQKAEAQRLMSLEATRPFDLSRDPMLRATLLRLSTKTSSTADSEHILLLTMHHIASDGWSMGVLVREMTALYEAFSQDQPSPLPDLPIQYADFAIWQRDYLQGEVLERQLRYWTEQLADAPELLQLPTDHARPAQQSGEGGVVSLQLDTDLTDALQTLSQQQGSTLYMTLLAAFQVLMARYSGQTDIVVGSPIANRNRQEIEPLIGFFINTLALRVDLSADAPAARGESASESEHISAFGAQQSPSFLAVLAQVRETVQAAYDHQDIPFERLVEELQLTRSLSHPPLVQVMFALQNAPMGAFELSGLNVTPTGSAVQSTRFDLEMHVWEVDDYLQGYCIYSTDLFDKTTIERMAGHFQTLLQGIVDNPAQPIAELPLLSEQEQHQLLHSWNNMATDYPADKSIHQLFEQQVERTPDAIALVFAPTGHDKQQRLTYRELNERANQLAHYLIAQGVGPDVLVGICVERSLSMVVGLLGILKAGGAYMPLDPSYPSERLRFMLHDAKVKVLLTNDRSVASLPENEALIVNLAQLLSTPKTNPNCAAHPANLAYVLYTSGSTGQPKGVAMPHRTLSNLINWQQQESHAPTRTLQFAPMNFDVSLQEVFSTLSVGATLVLVSSEIRRDPFALLEYLRSYRITRLFLPFIALQQLAEAANGEIPATLREVITAGEQLQITTAIAEWFRDSQCTLYNHYGPTESHVVTAYKLADEVAQWSTLPPIGRPIANTEIYILDTLGQPVPIGVAGELYIGGANVARGYLNRPQLTFDAFIPNPFGEGRVYKTGDLCRYLPDGNIEFLGRADYQVKIRGFRIELGEIEALLSQQPNVREAVVVVRSNESNKRLVAYIVGDVAGLRDKLRQQLPDYMIPSAFVQLEAMPLTPSGKIDRRGLPAPDVSALVSEDTFVPPSTPTQIALANIWSEVLGIFEVGIHNNFFELGGHSLLATQVVSRIRQTFALEFPLRTLFESPTVARLATSIDDRNRTTQRQARPAIPLADRSAPLPLSHAQERLWFLDQLGGERNAYNMPAALRLFGVLDVDALERALQEIVRRHESLRTTFVMGTGAINTGQPIQIIHPATFTLPVIELGTLSPAEQEAELNRLLMAEVNHAFDLSKGPLLRVTLLRLADQDKANIPEHILLINMHHIISDGWSMQIVGRELGALYSAFTQLRPASLPELSIQYADFAAWQRAWLAEETMAAQLDYWHTQLHNAPPLLMLPTDHPRPPVQSYKGTHHFFSLPAELSQRLQALSLASGTTLFMTMLAAFKILLMRYSGQEDIVVGSPIANRNLLEIEPLIGFFVNTLVLRSDLSGNPTFKELLAQLGSTTLDAYRHQDVPFEKVVEHLQPERHLSHSPLFQVMFDVLQSSFFTIDLPGLTVESVASEYPIAKFDLTLSIVQEAIPEDKESLVALIEYNTDLFLEATIERMAGHFQTLLQGIVDHPAQPIASLPLLTEREQHQLLVEWNECAASALAARAGPTVRGTATDYPKDKCIHQLFEQQVERTPDAIAVVFEDTQLTYRTLNTRANQLAVNLIAQGVGPDVLVGICIQRSVEMVVGLLGILKAGGAYVPLDPTLPAERLRYMLSDSGVELLLTESKLAGSLPSVVRMLNLDQEWAMSGPDSPSITRHAGVANVKTKVKANHLAYCIYTSGSTGKPKGVLVEHKSLVCRSTALKEAYSLSSRDRVLQFAGISFDVMAEELFPAWLSGATVVLRPPSLTDWQSWEQWLSNMKLTILNLPAPYWHEWVLELTTLPPDLRLVVVGSDKVLPSRLAKWQEQVNTSTVPERVCGGSVHRVEFLHAYGITEDTITTTLYKPSHDSRRMNSVPIGRPLPNTQLYILDRYQNPVPIGVPGELHIGGAGLARGYLNRPQLTKEKFIPNPFGRRTQACGGRLYKTGDLCRYLPDGNIEFLGRTDYQVKIRGFRIELGEIEAHLQQCVGVSEAVVVVIDSVTGKRLVAYIIIEDDIVIEDDVVAEVKDLRAQLTQKLPNYMIPSAFVRLDALPLTANGKVDRQALVVRSAGGTSEWRGQADFVGPRTATEAELADIWQQLLALSRVSIHDNFFTVGGDSILSLQLISRCRARGILITPQQIFEHQTIAELAAAVQSQFAPSTNGALHEAPWTLDAQALVTGEVPLTPIQHGWAALNLPNPHIYNQSILIEIDSRVDSASLRRALQILLRHHDALRLRYQETKAGWRQSFSPPTDEVLLWEVDLTELSESAVKETVVLITSRIERSLNLTKGPVMGLALLRRADGPSQLFWMTHHLVVDWVSWRILLADLETIYQQLAHEYPVQLPAKTSSFQRWARWLHDRGPTVFAHELDYWVSRFERVQPLPQDKANGVPTWASVRAVSAELTVEETQALLQQAPAAYATQINDLLLTALLQTIVEWTQEAVMLIELESHGRQPIANLGLDDDSEIDLSRTVGWFTSAFPVRLAYQPSDPGDLILSVKEQLRQVPNHGLGYGILRYIQQRPELMPFPMPLILPLSGQVCFNYLGQFKSPAANPTYNHPNGREALLRGTGMEGFASSDTFGDGTLSEFFKQNGSGQFWNLFDLELMVVTGQLRVIWLYSENVHHRDTVERLTQGFMTNLRHLITHCQQQARLQQAVYG